jgi:hypothetical protein
MKRLAFIAPILCAACGGARGAGEGTHCPTDHSVELGLQEEVNKLAGCTTLPGIVIRTGAPIDVAPLKDLEEITGDVSIGPTIGLDEIAFNGVLRVGGTIRASNNSSLRGLFFPRVERVGRIEIENNAVMTSISLPRLVTVDSSMVIADNSALELITASSLATVGKELVIAGHVKLSMVEMSALTHVEAARIEGNPMLSADVVDALTSKSSLHQPPTP